MIVLFRGLPGAGKTTAARALCATVLSADDYFLSPDGSYRFQADRLGDAHRQCLSNTEAALRLGIKRVAVANTFTREWEMAPYFALGDRLGVPVVAMIVENRHGGQNTHGVPDTAIEAMRDRFEVQL
jgi:predicted kinase